MSWNIGGVGGDVSAFPPVNTGGNLSETQIATMQANGVDSNAGTDIDVFVNAAQTSLSFPAPLYDTGNLDIDATRVGLTNNSGAAFSFEIGVGGVIKSDSTSNSAVIGVRINSSGGLGTGTTRKIPAGVTSGGASVDVGFGTSGAFTLQNGQSVWLEVSKNVTGTLIVESVLCIIKPIW